MLQLISRIVRALIARCQALAFSLRRLWIKICCPGVTLSGEGQKISAAVGVRATDGGQIIIGADCTLCRGLEIIAKGKVEIGDGTFIGAWGMIAASSASSITIGRDCLIAERVTIRDQDHETGRRDVPMRRAGFRSAPILIGDDVWVGAGAVILKGVTVGRGAVVAANAVVVRDVPPYQVVGGVPAVKISVRPGGND